jgi:ubiquinone biosynthesis protein
MNYRDEEDWLPNEEEGAERGGFELLQEQPPASLFSRFLATQSQFLGLLFGGGFAYLRHKEARGENYGLQYWLLRVLLSIPGPFLNQEIIVQPFPVQFRRRLELLGPTYIKLGQILSLREDVLPKPITDELRNLLDRLPVVSFDRYKELIEIELQRPVDSAFEWIDPLPLGSASLAQTHRARLRSGEDVVLKVLKPGVSATIQQDCILLRSLATVLQLFLARFQPRRLIFEFCSYTLREIDLRFEADNAETFTANFQDQSEVCFPKIFREYSSREVLCMELFEGLKPSPAVVDRLTPAERSRIIDLGVGSIMRMIFQHGFFHADLHPGNLIIFDDGRIGFIDLGMVGRIDDETRKGMLYYFVSLVMGDAANAARTLSSIAMVGDGSDLDEFRREVAALNHRWMSASTFADFSIAQLILHSVALAGRYRVYYPATIILMLKALVTVEGVGNLLDPNLDITGVAGKHVQSILRSQFDMKIMIKRSMILAPELFDLLLRTPAIISESMVRLERQSVWRAQRRQILGLKRIILAGFCLLAAALVITYGGPWLVWFLLALFGIVLGWKGLK